MRAGSERGEVTQTLSAADLEAIARAMHEAYVRQRRVAGELSVADPAQATWEELPESLRESNRSAARDIGVKLDLVGWELAAAADPPAPLTIESAELELLARQEHERWRRDLEGAGWTHGRERDPERRTHPMLVDWELLPESEREKDRQAVRAIPGVLAAVGYGLRRTR